MKINPDGTSRPETEQERIERVKTAMANIEARKDDPHGLRPETVVSSAYPSTEHDFANGQEVTYRDRDARVIGVQGPYVYIRYVDTRTQHRVPAADLFRKPVYIPGSADLKRAMTDSEYAPFEIGETVVAIGDVHVGGKVIGERPKAGETLIEGYEGTRKWVRTDTLVRAAVQSRQEAAARFAEAIINAPRKAPLKVGIKRLTETAMIPAQARHGDAGYDLHADEDATLYRGGRRLISTGLAVAIPLGYVGLIMPRSGLANKAGIDILGGVIDAGYRGEVKVILQSHDGAAGFAIKRGDRIAQLVVQPVEAVEFEEGELPPSERAEGGFGSTGTGTR